MGRPETLAAAIAVVVGIAVALWLAAMRPPTTPVSPTEPTYIAERLDELTRQARPTARPAGNLVDPAASLGANGLDCEATLNLVDLKNGNARIDVIAPCRVGEHVRVAYGPIQYDSVVGPNGSFHDVVPAFGPDVTADAVLGNGERLAAPSVPGVASVVMGLSWSGDASVMVSVLEPGIRVDRDRPGAGQVWTYGLAPKTQSTIYVVHRPAYPLRMQLKFTAADCGKLVSGHAFQAARGDLTSRDVRVALPTCDPDFESGVIRGLFDDIRVADN